MPTIYSRKAGLTWCAPSLEETDTHAERVAEHTSDDMVPAFVVRKMDDGRFDLVMLRIPEEEVEERQEVDLGAVPEQHAHGESA
jgi:hypothetical protein